MWARMNELLFKQYFGTRPITPLHNLYPSKPIFTRRVDGWLAKGLLPTCNNIYSELFGSDLQAAKTKQAIREESMQIMVVERGQAIEVQEQEIIRRERELDATIRKPAEAEKYRLEKLAEANRSS